MESMLLATRLQIPPEAGKTIRRTRLLDQLEQGVPRYKLTVLAAPAGYGKTTLLAQWARCSRLPVAWLSISGHDNTPEGLLRYLLAAWDTVQPGIRDSRLGLLLGGILPDIDTALAEFINAAADTPAPLAFVLDDYHLIEEPATHHTLASLIDHLPSHIHIVIAGRKEPPLPLARYRARQQLLELGMSDLQFLPGETATFLRQVMALDISEDRAASLHADLEGWAAGLQLAALTLRKAPHEGGNPGISGQHRFIADYLSEEVLASLPDDARQFLLQTSILDQLSGPLCAAVTGRQDSQQMLEMLERENLFLVALDDNRQWFRYHHLFADYLHEALRHQDRASVAELHRRAARWHFEHDLPDLAFDHALAAGDGQLAVKVVDHYINEKLISGELRLVKYWIDALPAEWHAMFPVLGLARAGYLSFSGDMEGCLRAISEVEQRLARAEGESARWQKARVNVVRCFIACIQNHMTEAEALADRALRDLPEDDLSYRPSVYCALGDTYRRNGRWDEAEQSYRAALAYSRSPGIRVQITHIYGALADLELRQGRLRAAENYWQRALAEIQAPENWGRLNLPVVGWVYIRMAELRYERNQLEEADEYLALGLEAAELSDSAHAPIAGNLLASRIRLTEGDLDEAAGYLQRVQPLVGNALFPDATGRFERLQLELWLAGGEISLARNWADAQYAGDTPEDQPERETARLALARALLASGDTQAANRAGTLLQRLIDMADAEGRTGLLIEALALRALAHAQHGEHAAALVGLERALRLAEPEGYVRLFADLGLPLARLLQEARSRGVMPDYIDHLLSAFAPAVMPAAGDVPTLPEPLTQREQEVLELLAAGLTNREIAGRLVISVETVKKHAGSIYGKLGVSHRARAVARARALRLLS